MSDTPQNDDPINEEVNEQVEINDSVPESDTGNQVQDESNEQVDEVVVAQEKANAAFNKQYGEKKQLERDLKAQRELNERLQQAEFDRQAAAVGNIPPMPDSFDDDFDEKMKRRDDAIIAQANFNAQQDAHTQQQQYQQQQVQAQKQAELNQQMQSYNARATELGIKQDELQAAANVVGNLGLSDDLVMHILADSDGPLIVKHMAANQEIGFELAQMSPFLVGAKLNEIKANAAALKPKTTNAPAPTAKLSGNGVDKDAGKYQNIKGATFE